MPEDRNTLFAVTGGKKKEKQPTPPPASTEDIMAAFAPDPELVGVEEDTRPIAAPLPVKEKTLPPPIVPPSPAPSQSQTQATSAFLANLPPGAPAKRRRSADKSFPQLHTTVSLSIDRRIEKDVNDFLDRGAKRAGNRTVFASQLFLKLLIDAGYKIDPNILSQSE